MGGSVVFAHLMDEYGSHEKVENKITRKNTRKPTIHPNSADHPDRKKLRSALVQSEERVTASVAWVTYAKYFRFAGSILWVPAIITLALLSQAASGESSQVDLATINSFVIVGNNLFLGLWTSHSIRGFAEGNYMAVYAALGVVQASFAFVLTYILAYVLALLIHDRPQYPS
jgi:ATP-binding cassette subfamily C (CFTR/MRP) protein 1